MNPPSKKMIKTNNNSSSAGSNNFTRKPRRSIKAEGNCLNGMLREGCAKVIDASKLGKRLSSEIWNSFGAIQVEDNFTYPSIDTKTVADGSSTLKICQFFVACSKCFSVFKYDGHAYGTTGLVKHVKICQGTNQRTLSSNSNANTNTTTTQNNSYATPNNNNNNNVSLTDQSLTESTATAHHSLSSVPNTSTHNANNNTNTTTTANTTPITTSNGSVSSRRAGRRADNSGTPKSQRSNQPSLRYLAKVVEELRCEQGELKQKIHELINILGGNSYVGQIQIISNDGVKVDADELQKSD